MDKTPDAPDLREFVSKALLDILGGVIDAQSNLHGCQSGMAVPEYGANLNPHDLNKLGLGPCQSVEFEVTVSAHRQDGKDTKISIANIITAGIGQQRSRSDDHGAKLRFKVPILFPVHKHSGACAK